MDILKDIIVALAKAVINQTVIYYFGKKSAKSPKRKPPAIRLASQMGGSLNVNRLK